MQRVNEILKATRLKKGLTLARVEHDTKIRLTILEHLEEGRYSKLPSDTFVKGLVKNYGEYLGLSPQWLLALFRREFAPAKNKGGKQAVLFPLGKTTFMLSSRQKISLSAVLFTTVFVLYLAFQYFSFLKAPSLMIDTPRDQERLTVTTVEVVGKTDADAKLSLNGQEVQLKNDGVFSQVVHLQEGTNTITLTAIGKSGKQTVVTRTILVESLPPVSKITP